MTTVSPGHGINALQDPEVVPCDFSKTEDVFCADVHWAVSLRGRSFPGRGAVLFETRPRSHLIGKEKLRLTNRREPRFGHWAPHLDSSDWFTAVPPTSPHWVQRVRGAAPLVGSCFPSPARERLG